MKTNIKVFLYLLMAFSLCFVSCKKQRSAKKMPASVSSYVYAYSSGTISIADPIRVRFTQPVFAGEETAIKKTDGLFNFSPSLKGETSWEDDRTLLFEPTSWMDSRTTYVATVNLGDIFENVPKDAQTFEFDFSTKEQYFDVQVGGLEAENPNQMENQVLNGTIYTSDVAKNEQVEKLLTAVQNNQSLPIRWEHSGNQMDHNFYIEKVKRTNDVSQVELNWKGNALGVNLKGDKTISIPALGDFKVMDARVIQDNEQYIALHFSDPLLQSQELNGLITLTNYRGQIRYIIDGSEIRVYPAQRITGERTVKVYPGVKNIKNNGMKTASEWAISFESEKPQLRLAGKGVIMPNSQGLIFPFEAIGLNTVDIEIFKIYDNNILQFLQTNQLDDHYELERVGKVIMQKKIKLQDLNPEASSAAWSRYAVDLKQLVDQDPNAIYQVRVGFKQGYTSYFCGTASNSTTNDDLEVLEASFSDDGEIKSIWDDSYYYYDGYRWTHREDPCFPAYYRNHNFVRRNILTSDLGLIAKRGNDGSTFVAVSDLRTTDPLAGVQLDFYDYTQQLIKTVFTDADGTALIEIKPNPFVVVATNNNQKGYLRLMDPNALSLSRFDVSGTTLQKGLKGYIYGERGVWRPGDSLFLNFVLEDKSGKLPANHPVNFELFDPRGQVQQRFTSSENINNVYPLKLATNPDAPTGNWRAVVKAGGATFSKTLKIETVKPNRLKVRLDFGKEELSVSDKNLNGNLQVNWLHGAPAQNLKAKVEVQVQSMTTKFDKFNEYVFDDPARYFNAEPQVIFDDQINSEGFARVNSTINVQKAAPGKLKASFKSRAFEQSGDFSIDNFSLPYHPYNTYAGIFIKKNKYNEKRLDINKDNEVEFVAVDKDGKPINNKNLNVGFYRVNWRWWWDRDENENISRYNSSTHYGALDKGNVTTNSKGESSWTIKPERWGRYLVRVCDEDSGHCSGDFFYAGYPWYDDDGGNREAAAMLNFTADKEKYEVGDVVELSIPASDIGRCLVSLETGSKVVETHWTETKSGDNKFTFYATSAMAPTIYAHVTLVQPHAQVKNDLPIRMYGVIPITIEDPSTRLQPQLKMADVLKPEETVKIQVSEKKGKPMAYTIAMVDDGLLDLTRFKTPNPFDAFYAREALGVNTWDVYDHVLGAYGGKLERILSIGGDDEVVNPQSKNTANRFKPVVKFLGPFYLKSGDRANHEINVPNYVGSVRTMVVASDNGAYGSSEKTTPVRKPLMVLATLPRVLGPTEKLRLPVNVFAMEDKVKNVTVKVEESSGLVRIIGGDTQNLSFTKPGEQMAFFDLEVAPGVGIANFKVTASGSNESASQEIEIEIRNPNPRVTEVFDEVVEAGQNWNQSYEAFGMKGTNEGILEISNIPPLNLGERLEWLIRYPHGCIEQTTSSGFPQLYVDRLIEMEEGRKLQITRNIKATIERLKMFQLGEGGFTYWPGGGHASWGSNYAGHFLLEAEAKGYTLPVNMKKRWIKSQKRHAQNWTAINSGNRYHGGNHELDQAYRLYTLALAKSPEWGAMNRLRERKNLSLQARWRLAAAYAVAGKTEVAQSLINNVGTEVEEYRELSGTYGSALRDEAMILETLNHLGNKKEGGLLARSISEQISKDYWYSTQTIAYALLAVGKYIGNTDVSDSFTFAYQVGNDAKVNAGSKSPIIQIKVPVDENNNPSFTITNTGKNLLFARFIQSGQPVIGDQTASSNNLNMAIKYKTMDGQPLDPSRIQQGTDFIAEVSISNPGRKGINYDEMALSQIFPSGWEIHNSRMDQIDAFSNTTKPEYQDIRDDRVYTYFDIRKGKSQIYRIQLNAAYQGRYYLPTTYCEAMYDHSISAREPGMWVEVVGSQEM